jgi:hypothetical protein
MALASQCSPEKLAQKLMNADMAKKAPKVTLKAGSLCNADSIFEF